MTDPIADMLTRMRNALAVKKDEVVLPMSKIKYSIAKVLEKEGWVGRVEILGGGTGEGKSRFDQLRIVLKYNRKGNPEIRHLKRISKPGLKVYVKKTELPKVLNNLGIAIISTPEGIMTNKDAKTKGLGGEVICEIY